MLNRNHKIQCKCECNVQKNDKWYSLSLYVHLNQPRDWWTPLDPHDLKIRNKRIKKWWSASSCPSTSQPLQINPPLSLTVKILQRILNLIKSDSPCLPWSFWPKCQKGNRKRRCAWLSISNDWCSQFELHVTRRDKLKQLIKYLFTESQVSFGDTFCVVSVSSVNIPKT